MGLLKSMSRCSVLEHVLLNHDLSPLIKVEQDAPSCNLGWHHKMLCFFFQKFKDFVKITFDKWHNTLYNI